MNVVDIMNQEQYDALPDNFEFYTVIQIKSEAKLWLRVGRVPENSRVEAWGSAHVVAWESAHVEAWGSAHVVARESAHVVARESAHVEAWGNSSIKALSQWCELSIKQFAVAICVDANPKIIEQDDTATCIKSPMAVDDKTSFIGIHKGNVQEDGRIMLVKMVQEDNTDFYTGKIKYEGLVKCPDWDPDPNRQCGGGLHLSATETEARIYNNGKAVRCLVHSENITVYGPDISKVRCSEVCAEVPCRDCGKFFFPNQTWTETKGIWVCPECMSIATKEKV